MLYENEYLAHHGVKGQKWGRRKQRIKNGIRRNATNIRNSRPAQNAKREIHGLARRRAYTRNGQLKSKRGIIAGTIASSIGIGVGGGVAAAVLDSYGHEKLSDVTKYATTGAMAVNAAIGITSAVQRGRGRYNK